MSCEIVLSRGPPLALHLLNLLNLPRDNRRLLIRKVVNVAKDRLCLLAGTRLLEMLLGFEFEDAADAVGGGGVVVSVWVRMGVWLEGCLCVMFYHTFHWKGWEEIIWVSLLSDCVLLQSVRSP